MEKTGPNVVESRRGGGHTDNAARFREAATLPQQVAKGFDWIELLG
ncbi:hypothetical protein ELI_06475 [Erythrobacter litoralis HTCC2594]|uniref:Uncharacterized protein n=1 Tax=Erythrobacter litoralis (strain HTCC2594) TaxID=314225 RepID=Q2NAA4_ERYLH|nr:hypothetical protein ELI_06475 [Erythrobacter litoralis HTCC2594]